MGKLGDMCMEDVRKARAVFWCSGDAELAAQLTKWLEEMEKELAEEQEPKTVTLQEPGDGYDRKYRQIDKIEPVGDDIACLYDVPVCHVTGTHPMCGGYLENSICVIAGDPAEITRLARAAWSDFDCDGAEPRLRPTVTLQCVGESILAKHAPYPIRFSSIHHISQGQRYTHVSGMVEGQLQSRCVAEMAAAITVAARDAWSTEEQLWSCPGAEPPVVVLHSQQKGTPIVFTKIIAMPANGCPTLKGIVRGQNDGNPVHIWYDLEEDRDTIIAAAAAAGVPCPAEEKPELLVGYDPGFEEGDKSVYVEKLERHCAMGERDVQVLCTRNAELDKRVAELEAEVANMKEAYDGRNKEVRKIVAAKNNAQERIAELEAERFELLDERGNLKSRLGGCRTRNTDLQSELNAALRNYDAYVVEMTDKCKALEERLNELGNWRKTEPCPECKGNGYVLTIEMTGCYTRPPCTHCNGTGLVVKHEEGKDDTSAN